MKQLSRGLAILVSLIAIYARANSQTNYIDALVERINARNDDHLWLNGVNPEIKLSSNATPQEVVDDALTKYYFGNSKVKSYRILESRKVKLWDLTDCSAALIDSDLGMKILLFGYGGVGVHWWIRRFDVPERATPSVRPCPTNLAPIKIVK